MIVPFEKISAGVPTIDIVVDIVEMRIAEPKTGG